MVAYRVVDLCPTPTKAQNLQVDLPPGQVLRRLDKMAAGLAAAPFAATCIYAVIGPSGSCCEIAQVSHPPAGACTARRATRVLDLPSGHPLGLSAEAFQATRVSLPPGATIALYTRWAGGRPRPAAGPRHGRAARRAELSAGPVSRAAGKYLRDGQPVAAPARRGRRHPRPRAHPPSRSRGGSAVSGGSGIRAPSLRYVRVRMSVPGRMVGMQVARRRQHPEP